MVREEKRQGGDEGQRKEGSPIRVKLINSWNNGSGGS